MSSEQPDPSKEQLTGEAKGLLSRIFGATPTEGSSHIPRLTRDQVDTLVQIAREEQEREDRLQMSQLRLHFILGMTTLVGVCFLCWLFLYFKQQQFIDKVIIAILGGLAGSGMSLGALFGRQKRK